MSRALAHGRIAVALRRARNALRALAASILLACTALAQGVPAAEKLLAPNEETLREILKAAGDPNRDVRARVAWVLGQMDRKDSVPALEGLARKDPIPAVRAGALRVLGDLLPRGEKITVDLEVPVEDVSLRIAALVAARRFFFAQRDKLIEAAIHGGTLGDMELAIQALELDPPSRSLPILEAAARHELPAARRAAVLALGRIAGAESAPRRSSDGRAAAAAFAAFTDKDPTVRAAACEAAALLKAADARVQLVRATSDEHYFVRRNAIEALADRGETGAVDPIHPRTTDSDFTVREAACVALGRLLQPSSAPFLADALADDVVEVRSAAALSLAKFSPEVALAPVLKYTEYRKRADTRRRAWWVLGEWASPKTADMSLEHVRDDDSDVRCYALRVLRKLGDRRVIPHVVKMLTFPALEKAAVPETEEAFLIAILFKLKEPIPAAMHILDLVVNPPPEPLWLPTDVVLSVTLKYVAAVDHKPAAGMVKKICVFNKMNSIVGPVAAETLEKLTGEKFELPPPPGPSRGHFFIHVPRDDKAGAERAPRLR